MGLGRQTAVFTTSCPPEVSVVFHQRSLSASLRRNCCFPRPPVSSPVDLDCCIEINLEDPPTPWGTRVCFCLFPWHLQSSRGRNRAPQWRLFSICPSVRPSAAPCTPHLSFRTHRPGLFTRQVHIFRPCRKVRVSWDDNTGYARPWTPAQGWR